MGTSQHTDKDRPGRQQGEAAAALQHFSPGMQADPCQGPCGTLSTKPSHDAMAPALPTPSGPSTASSCSSFTVPEESTGGGEEAMEAFSLDDFVAHISASLEENSQACTGMAPVPEQARQANHLASPVSAPLLARQSSSSFGHTTPCMAGTMSPSQTGDSSKEHAHHSHANVTSAEHARASASATPAIHGDKGTEKQAKRSLTESKNKAGAMQASKKQRVDTKEAVSTATATQQGERSGKKVCV